MILSPNNNWKRLWRTSVTVSSGTNGYRKWINDLFLFLAGQNKKRPFLQAASALQPGSAAPPEPFGVPRAPHTPVRQEEGRVPQQKQHSAAKQLVEQRLLVVALCRLQRQRPRQGPVAAQQAEQLQVRTRRPRQGRHGWAPSPHSPHPIGRGTVRVALTTTGLGAAREATRPSAREDEIRPVSWRPAGSPGTRPTVTLLSANIGFKFPFVWFLQHCTLLILRGGVSSELWISAPATKTFWLRKAQAHHMDTTKITFSVCTGLFHWNYECRS